MMGSQTETKSPADSTFKKVVLQRIFFSNYLLQNKHFGKSHVLETVFNLEKHCVLHIVLTAP